MSLIIENMEIPDACYLGKTIFKKMFYDMGIMTNKDKELFKNDISKIVWQYALKPSNLNIPKYKDEIREYDELAVIDVALNSNGKFKRICEVIQQSIPYPLFLVLNVENKTMLSVAHKRTNQSDPSKNTIEEHVYTEWIELDNITKRQNDFLDSLAISKQPYSNLYEFYHEYVGSVIKLNTSIHADDFESIAEIDTDRVKAIKAKVDALDFEMKTLRSKIKKESNFSAKVKINIAIKKLEEEKSELLEGLSE